MNNLEHLVAIYFQRLAPSVVIMYIDAGVNIACKQCRKSERVPLREEFLIDPEVAALVRKHKDCHID